MICQIMTYDAYEIWMWHMSNLSILVSKRPYGTQQSHLVIRFGLKKMEKLKNWKMPRNFLPYMHFRESFVFWGPKRPALGKVDLHPTNLFFVFSQSMVSKDSHKHGSSCIYDILGSLSHPNKGPLRGSQLMGIYFTNRGVWL